MRLGHLLGQILPIVQNASTASTVTPRPIRGDGAGCGLAQREKKQTMRRAGTLPGALRGIPLPHHQLCTGQAPPPLGLEYQCAASELQRRYCGGGLSCGVYQCVNKHFRVVLQLRGASSELA